MTQTTVLASDQSAEISRLKEALAQTRSQLIQANQVLGNAHVDANKAWKRCSEIESERDRISSELNRRKVAAEKFRHHVDCVGCLVMDQVLDGLDPEEIGEASGIEVTVCVGDCEHEIHDVHTVPWLIGSQRNHFRGNGQLITKAELTGLRDGVATYTCQTTQDPGDDFSPGTH